MSQPMYPPRVDPIDELVVACDGMIEALSAVPDDVPSWILEGGSPPADGDTTTSGRRQRYTVALRRMHRPLLFGGAATLEHQWQGLLRLAREVGQLIADRSATPLGEVFERSRVESERCLFHRFGMQMSGMFPPLEESAHAYVEKACAVAVVLHVRGDASLPSVRAYACRERHDMLMTVVMLAWLRSLISRDLFFVQVCV